MPSNRFVIEIALLATLVAGATACHKPEAATPPGAVAMAGNRVITSDDFTRYLERNAGSALNQLAPPAASALLDQNIQELLLAESAVDSGIVVSSASVANAVRNDPGSTPVEKRDEMERSRLLADLAARIPPATEAEVNDFYVRHSEEFKAGEQIHVRQILVHTEVDATAAQRELAAGDTFEAVSKKYSKAPNASHGGDIGFVERGQLPKVFEDVVFALRPGQVSPTIASDTNFFHIFKVDEKRPAGALDAKTARPVIEERLREEKLRTAIERLVAETAKRKVVRVYKRRLSFPYEGNYPVELE